jgi:osmotically-inducible protein OsmY
MTAMNIRPVLLLTAALLSAGSLWPAAARTEMSNRQGGHAAIWQRVQAPVAPEGGDVLVPPLKSDWEIERDVSGALFASPLVDQQKITVTVADGVAHLTGTVRSLAEREAAERSALEAGARAVDNDLAVVGGPHNTTPPTFSDPDPDAF